MNKNIHNFNAALIISLISILLAFSCSSEKEYQEALQVYKAGGENCYLEAVKMLNDIPSYFSPSYNSSIRFKNPTYSKAQILVDEIKESYINYIKNYLVEKYKNNLIVYLLQKEEGHPYLCINTIDGKNQIKMNYIGKWLQPLWSPDGQHILFYGLPQGEMNPIKGNDLFICDNEGKNITRLTNSPGEDSEPSWSPDSKKVVFIRDDGNSCRLFIYDIDKKREELLYPTAKNPKYRPIDNPHFMPNQKAIISLFGLSLTMINLNNGKSEEPSSAKEIFGNELISYFERTIVQKIDFSPDGKSLLFIYDNLYQFNLEQKQIIEIGNYWSTALSKDEKYILYDNQDDDGSYLYIKETAVEYNLPPIRLFKGSEPDWLTK